MLLSGRSTFSMFNFKSALENKSAVLYSLYIPRSFFSKTFSGAKCNMGSLSLRSYLLNQSQKSLCRSSDKHRGHCASNLGGLPKNQKIQCSCKYDSLV